MIYGYARVSTYRQGKDGNSLEDQREKLVAAGAEVIFSDVFTGTAMNRPEFDKLMKELKPGDTLVVTKLDRFARTAVEGGQIAQELHRNGISLNILNMGMIDANDNSPVGKLTLTILLAFAEFERDMIVERTQTGRANARAKGIKVDGRPKKFGTAKINHALELLDEGYSYSKVEEMTGISKSTLIRARRNQRASEEE